MLSSCPGCIDCGPPIVVKAEERCGRREDAMACDAEREAFICTEDDAGPVLSGPDAQTRCCQCGRTESWSPVGLWELLECACGHELCAHCHPIPSPQEELA